jgi:hypothetical protein
MLPKKPIFFLVRQGGHLLLFFTSDFSFPLAFFFPSTNPKKRRVL